MLETFSVSEPCLSKEDKNRGRRDSFNHILTPILMNTVFPSCSKEYTQNKLNLQYLHCLPKRFLLCDLTGDCFQELLQRFLCAASPTATTCVTLRMPPHPPQPLACNTQENDHLPPSLIQTTVAEIRKPAFAHYWLFLSQWPPRGTKTSPGLKIGLDRTTH